MQQELLLQLRSTNAALHLPAIANEAGLKFTLRDVVEIYNSTPYIGDMQPEESMLRRFI